MRINPHAERQATALPIQLPEPFESAIQLLRGLTAGAGEALVTMAVFVVFGLGWAALEDLQSRIERDAARMVATEHAERARLAPPAAGNYPHSPSRAVELDPDSLLPVAAPSKPDALDAQSTKRTRIRSDRREVAAR